MTNSGAWRILNSAFGLAADLAGVALVVLMAATVLDIATRQLGLLNLRGIVEISTFAIMLIGFMALAESFVAQAHIVVDLATQWMPRRFNRALDALWIGFAACCLGYVAFRMWLAAFEVRRSSDLSLDLQLPMVVFWLPAAIGVSLAPLACLVALRRKLARADSSD
jgi:TRAP-type C4-dicarboxylate transport system permease small subunit